MGETRNKLLAPVGGQPLVTRPVDAVLGAKVPRIVVVTGFEAERVEAELAGRPVECLRHAGWQRGMASSVAAGVRHLTELEHDLRAIFVVLGDLPHLRAAELRRLAEAFEAEENATSAEAAIFVPSAQGRRGHPVLFGRAHFEALRTLSQSPPGEEDLGARRLLEAHPERVRIVEVDHVGPVLDVDTPADLARARQAASEAAPSGSSRPPR